MRKSRVVIAGSVNNDFEPLAKLTDRSLKRDGPTGRESRRGWPISCGRSVRYRYITCLCFRYLVDQVTFWFFFFFAAEC